MPPKLCQELEQTFQQKTIKDNNGSASCVYMSEQAQAKLPVVNSNFLDQYIHTPNSPTFSQAWRTARNRKTIRVATGRKWDKPTKRWVIAPKTPFKKKWQEIKEIESSQALEKKYKEYGERLGTKWGKYYDYIIDLDFYKKGRNKKLSDHYKKTFIKIMKLYGVKWEETSSGNAHVNLLLEEPTENGIITNITKYGKIERIGELLGKGKQARATHKKEQGEGKWKIKAKNISEVIKIFDYFFWNIKIKEKTKEKTTQIKPRNIKVYEPLNNMQIISELLSESIKDYQQPKENTQILVKNAKLGKRKRLNRPGDPLYKQHYNGKRYFLLDTKYSGNIKDSILDDLTEGSIRTFILNQGNKHQFFKQLWTEPT